MPFFSNFSLLNPKRASSSSLCVLFVSLVLGERSSRLSEPPHRHRYRSMDGSGKTELGEPEEATDPVPDIHALFCHYNALYFQDALGACIVSWNSSPPMNSCKGTCVYHPDGGCEILLSEPLMKSCLSADVKNTLLHEMIHAFLWINNKIGDHSDHGSCFVDMMDSINSSSVTDDQKPSGGYNIATYHEYHKKVDSDTVHQWICDSCGDLIERSMNREPSPNDCIENTSHGGSCGNSSCHWHRHKKSCSGSYTKVAESSGFKNKKTSSKGEQEPPIDRFKGLHYRRTMRRSSGIEGKKEEPNGKKVVTITTFFPSEEVVGRHLGSNSSSADGCQRELHCEDSKANGLKNQNNEIAPEIPKRVRAPVSKKKHIYTGRKRKKRSRHQYEYNVIIRWLDVYADEESEEDVNPLINKRTERRKKQKLLKSLKGRTPVSVVMDDASPSHTSSCCRIGEDINVDGSLLSHKDSGKCTHAMFLEDQIEKCGIPVDVDSEQESGKIQVHIGDGGATETMDYSVPSQLAHVPSNVSGGHRNVKSLGDSYKVFSPVNSPVRCEIVDISDG